MYAFRHTEHNQIRYLLQMSEMDYQVLYDIIMDKTFAVIVKERDTFFLPYVIVGV